MAKDPSKPFVEHVLVRPKGAPPTKKAKVSKGIVHHVWPWVKVLPDGTRLDKKMPMHYRARVCTAEGIEKQQHECIVDVPWEVRPGWRWNKKTKKYEKPSKEPIVDDRRSVMVEVLAEKLGISYDDLWGEILARKKARKLGPPKAQR